MISKNKSMIIQPTKNMGLKISGKNNDKNEVTVLFNPEGRQKGEIVCFTNADAVDKKLSETTNALIIQSPGEYEKMGVFVQSLPFDKNIIYYLEFEGIKLLHLGKIDKILEEKILDPFDGIDILFVALNDKTKNLINQIEPKIFIPIDYTSKNVKLLKDLGLSSNEVLDKFSIKRKELPEKDTKGILLKF